MTNPNVIASGTTAGGYSVYIDTGVSVGGNWYTAASEAYGCSATIASGTSFSGGNTMVAKAEIWIGDGLTSQGLGPYIDGRIYIKAEALQGNFTPTSWTWKLFKL